MQIYIFKFEKKELIEDCSVVSIIHFYINADTKENTLDQVTQIVRNNFDKFKISSLYDYNDIN
jgi:hypothetical protein